MLACYQTSSVHTTQSILDGEEAFCHYVRRFLSELFPRGDVPIWVVEALAVAGIDVADMKTAESSEDIERSTTGASSGVSADAVGGEEED